MLFKISKLQIVFCYGNSENHNSQDLADCFFLLLSQVTKQVYTSSISWSNLVSAVLWTYREKREFRIRLITISFGYFRDLVSHCEKHSYDLTINNWQRLLCLLKLVVALIAAILRSAWTFWKKFGRNNLRFSALLVSLHILWRSSSCT